MDVLHAHQGLSDPVRLGIAQELLVRDLSPGEIAHRWELSTNLVAHHVKVLVDAGLVERRRSEHDARRSYLMLLRSDRQVVAMVGLGLAPIPAPARVAFVCTRNSARSKLAAASWRRVSHIPVVDAGTDPTSAPHPMTIQAARHRGLDLDLTMHAAADTLVPGDLVVAVCDHAHEGLAADDNHYHWSVPDPVVSNSASAFDRTCADLQERIAHLDHALSSTERSLP